MIGAEVIKAFNWALSNLFISSREKINTSVVALGLLKSLVHSPFSPDLVFSNFHISWSLVKYLKGKHFRHHHEMAAEACKWVQTQHPCFFSLNYTNGVLPLAQVVVHSLSLSWYSVVSLCFHFCIRRIIYCGDSDFGYVCKIWFGTWKVQCKGVKHNNLICNTDIVVFDSLTLNLSCYTHNGDASTQDYGLEPLNFLFFMLQCSNCHGDGVLLFHILSVLFTAKI